jgi:hypothetical protein
VLIDSFCNSDQFPTFFARFAHYVEQFQPDKCTKPFLKKNTKSVLANVLKSARSILLSSGQYTPSIVPDLTRAFLVLLHPQNPRRIRGQAASLVMELIDHLGSDAIIYTGGLLDSLLNFQMIHPKTSHESPIGPRPSVSQRLQLTDDEPDDGGRAFLDQLDELLRTLSLQALLSSNADLFLKRWELFERIILSVLYRKEGVIVPEEVHSRVITILTELVSRDCLTLFANARMATLDYFFTAALQCSHHFPGNEPSRSFILRFFEKVSHQPDKLLKNQSLELLKRGLRALLACLQGHSGSKDKSAVDTLTRALIPKYFTAMYSDRMSDDLEMSGSSRKSRRAEQGSWVERRFG